MSNVAADTAAVFCATLVDEWSRNGVTHAVVCPGSRSTPLALALVRHGGLQVSVRLDERGAGFFGIGLALATRRPTVVLTTSGTAAAELHAAVVEAHHARVPLIVCTADRPPELHDVGAPQTIDQTRLFGRAVRFFAEPGVPDEAARDSWRSLASRAVAEARDGPLGPGPVHLNLAFREPLLGRPGELPAARAPQGSWHRVVPPGAGATELASEIADGLRPGARGVIVAGAGADEVAGDVAALACELGWPVLADPRSRCRSADRNVIGAADALLRVEAFAHEMTPEVVLSFGEPWASKVVAGWISKSAGHGALHIALDPHWTWRDPGRDVAVLARALPPASWHRSAPWHRSASGGGAREVGPWMKRWAEAEEAAQRAIDGVLSAHAEVTEPGVARALYRYVPPDGCIVASSSMPVRDLEWFGRPRPTPPRVLANRGANGIDGVVSTVLGVAAARSEKQVFGLVGDLAVLHDASALVRPAGRGPSMDAVVVVLDNGGGGIFNFLPQAGELAEAEFELLFGTPQLPRVADFVRACGYEVTELSSAGELVGALDASSTAAAASALPAFVVVHGDRRANVALHSEIESAVRGALEGSAP
ncbi:MAG: 2-succinyl-5-enolpyruvyl-6-hydroxy-3-cyclohexene-1-carboxylic-acid synthase [Actinomycetota bacterium]|nr:2-succinyl-5-enolpyruvyl-6-hydroxy-3-cyclohexene-1-carboxylic-acid synthase [Actinomycetota bacterium]